MLAITEDEIQKEMSGIKASMGQGNLQSDSLRTAMIKLFVRMRRRRGITGLSDRMKRAYDTYIT
jgi:hypothetical protein